MKGIIVGIDISKKKFDVAYEAGNRKWQQGTFDNNTQGFRIFIKWLNLKNTHHIHIVMEATGRYGEDLAQFIYNAGHQVSIINPAQIKYYGRSLLRRTKTDKIDSKLIAEFAQRHELPIWKPLSPRFQSLKDQVRCLESFKRDAQQISNRLEHAKDPVVRDMMEERLTYIQKQVKELILIIKKLTHDDPILSYNLNLLVSIPGIGEITALALLGELPDLSTFKCAKQLAAYAGLNPSIRTSGISVKGKETISKTGIKSLRKILFFPAMVIMRIPSPLNQFVKRLREKGKNGKVIVAAVMRKLLHIIFGVLKSQTIFQG